MKQLAVGIAGDGIGGRLKERHGTGLPDKVRRTGVLRRVDGDCGVRKAQPLSRVWKPGGRAGRQAGRVVGGEI